MERLPTCRRDEYSGDYEVVTVKVGQLGYTYFWKLMAEPALLKVEWLEASEADIDWQLPCGEWLSVVDVYHRDSGVCTFFRRCVETVHCQVGALKAKKLRLRVDYDSDAEYAYFSVLAKKSYSQLLLEYMDVYWFHQAVELKYTLCAGSTNKQWMLYTVEQARFTCPPDVAQTSNFGLPRTLTQLPPKLTQTMVSKLLFPKLDVQLSLWDGRLQEGLAQADELRFKNDWERRNRKRAPRCLQQQDDAQHRH
jgi:hypothetical protein